MSSAPVLSIHKRDGIGLPGAAQSDSSTVRQGCSPSGGGFRERLKNARSDFRRALADVVPDCAW
jgi:hypothetical protein